MFMSLCRRPRNCNYTRHIHSAR